MSLYLYNFTLQKPAGITNAIFGNFSEPKAQEIVVSRGRVLELLRPDENGKVQTILSTEVFGLIRSLRPFRLTGGTRDYIIIGADSGRITILDYNAEHNRFDKIHEETYGRTGMRRVVPGQYLTTDPKGRAVMIGAIEKSKFVYILNRDSAAKLTISSPLEAHKAHTICFDVVGVDVGFDNPLFAALEVDYEEMDEDASGEAIANAEKTVTFYELDLGLNHVTRQSSEKCPITANILLAVPGTPDGPGGVLICCEDKIVHRNTQHKDHEVILPRRRDVPRDRGVLITSYALVKQRDWFFFLVQTEYGDLFKVWLDFDGDEIKNVNVKYFDTLPLATSMAVLKTGFLFLGAESGNHMLYQFQGIGDDDEDVTFMIESDERIFFAPRSLRNLIQIDEMPNAFPITDLLVDNLCNEETPQIFAACGNGPRSSLRVLRQGIAVNERAVSGLPGVPSAVWSIKTHSSDQFDKYIVLSFKDATMVLSIGETVEEVHDSGFLPTAPTLHAAMVGDDALIQVHPDGLRHIRADKRVQEWKPPAGKKIRQAAANLRQIAITLVGGEIVYFELDTSGQIVEVDKTSLGKEIVAIGIAPVPEGRQRTRFLAVADVENKMRIYSLNPTDTLQSLSMQVLPARVSSLCIMEMAAFGGKALYVNIGLVNGVLFRATIDRSTGQLSDNRARFLGARPVKLFPIKQAGEDGVLALSSRSWLLYNYQRKFSQNPISYTPLEYASGFRSEQCPEGIVSIAGDSLRIFTIEQLGQMFNQTVIPLRYTPRKLIVHQPYPLILKVIAESDQDVFSSAELTKIREAQKEEDHQSGRAPVKMEVDGEMVEESLPDEQYGVSRSGLSKWASCIRLLDVANSKTLDLVELGNNEVITSVCFTEFVNTQGETFLCVGTAKELKYEPIRTCTAGFIHIYRVFEGKLQLMHKTELNGIPGAVCGYQGRLIVGVGNLLRIYDFGKKKMLRKCENKDIPNHITSIWLSKDKIVVGDVQFSYHYGKYNRSLNQIFFFADDTIPRWITSGVQIDGTTIAGGDKFGNIFTLRLPEQVERMLAEDPSGGAVQWNNRQIIGAPHKLTLLNSFYVGETIAKVAKTTITPGGRECIFYATVFGTIGVLVPFQSREDVDFYTKLEMHMRQEFKSLVGREHQNFRSYYTPVKAVVDGDLCEQFVLLSGDVQKKIADDLDRTPAEVQKKLEDIRNNL